MTELLHKNKNQRDRRFSPFVLSQPQCPDYGTWFTETWYTILVYDLWKACSYSFPLICSMLFHFTTLFMVFVNVIYWCVHQTWNRLLIKQHLLELKVLSSLISMVVSKHVTPTSHHWVDCFSWHHCLESQTAESNQGWVQLMKAVKTAGNYFTKLIFSLLLVALLFLWFLSSLL